MASMRLKDQIVEVSADDYVLDRIHSDFKQSGVGSIGIVSVHLLLWISY